MPERLRGHIRWFSHQKRYGRIQRGPGLSDVFVQIEDLTDIEGLHKLEDGALVEFSIEQTLAGPKAANIVVLAFES
jgi:cold shock CspA family protein